MSKHSWSAHPLLIRWRPEHFNSQLKFAGWSADVTTIHSSIGLLAAAWRSAHGGPRATVGNYLLCWPNGHRRDAVRTPVGDRSIICQFAPPNCCYVIAWSSNDARAIIQRSSTVSPWTVLCMCTVLCCFMLLCCYVYIIYWMILNNKHKILVMLLIYYFLSCIVLPCVYRKYYDWNKCCYVFSVLLALK